MGACLCKDQPTDVVQNPTASNHNGSTVPSNRPTDQHPNSDCSECDVPTSTSHQCHKWLTSGSVDRLVLDTLSVIGSLVENEQEPPASMLKLHAIADNEAGWLQVVGSMIDVIPMSDPLGPAVITLLLDDCPLPMRETVLRLSERFDLTTQRSRRGRGDPTRQRNVCVVLGCLAEKLAGQSSISILTPGTLNYLVANLNPDINELVILFSLIALEKFAQTSENKVTIKKRLTAEAKNPLLLLERWVSSDHYLKRQVGFCAQWCLDNLFLVDGRHYSYELVNTAGINVMLNTNDVSEYLKISPDGLEARCDAYSFESVRCTYQVDSGVWYYETLIITPGVMQIGWATRNSTFLNHEGYGIGDDEHSVAYDGCRRLMWHNARNEAQSHPCWRPGDTVGTMLDLDTPQVVFYVNGVPLQPPCTHLFNTSRSGFFAAASFMSFQQCRFNFGSSPFRYPPAGVRCASFNAHATLAPEDKVVLPRHIRLEQLRKTSVREDSCALCFDKRATVRLVPCGHRGFCSTCSVQLSECPMCRASIREAVTEPSSS